MESAVPPQLQEQILSNIEKVKNLLERASSSPSLVRLAADTIDKPRQNEVHQDLESTASEIEDGVQRLSLEREQIERQSKNSLKNLENELEKFAKAEESIRPPKADVLLVELDSQIAVMEKFQDRIYQLNSRMLKKQEHIVSEHTSAIQTQTLDQMQKWQDMQMKQLESQNRHFIKLNSTLKQAMKSSQSNIPKEITKSKTSLNNLKPAESSLELKSQLEGIRNDFSKFINEVEGLRQMIKENKPSGKSNSTSQEQIIEKSFRIENSLKGAVGDYNILSQMLGTTPLDLLLPQGPLLPTMTKDENGAEFRDFVKKIHELLSKTDELDECKKIFEDLRERRKKLEARLMRRAGEDGSTSLSTESHNIKVSKDRMEERFLKTVEEIKSGKASSRHAKPDPGKAEPGFKKKTPSGIPVSSNVAPDTNTVSGVRTVGPSSQWPDRPPVKRSVSPLKEAIPRFYNVRVSDGPVFLRRTTVRPPALDFLYKKSTATSPQKPRQVPVSVVSRSVSPKRDFQSHTVQTDDPLLPPPSPAPPPEPADVPQFESSTQTLPTEWLQEALLRKMLQRKKPLMDRSSSTSEIKQKRDFAEVAFAITQEILDEVTNRELRLLMINLLGAAHFNDGLARVIAKNLIDEVVREMVLQVCQREKVLCSVAQLISTEILNQVVIAEMTLVLSDELSRIQVIEPQVVSAVSSEIEQASHEVIDYEHVAVQTAAVQTEKSVSSKKDTSSSETQPTTTTLSTLISDGEMFSEMVSEGEYVGRIAGQTIEALAFNRVQDLLVTPKPAVVPHKTVSADLSAGEQAPGYKSPGELTDPLSPALSDGKPSFGQSFQIHDSDPQSPLHPNMSEAKARNILEKMTEWASSSNDVSEMGTTIPDITEHEDL